MTTAPQTKFLAIREISEIELYDDELVFEKDKDLSFINIDKIVAVKFLYPKSESEEIKRALCIFLENGDIRWCLEEEFVRLNPNAIPHLGEE